MRIAQAIAVSQIAMAIFCQTASAGSVCPDDDPKCLLGGFLGGAIGAIFAPRPPSVAAPSAPAAMPAPVQMAPAPTASPPVVADLPLASDAVRASRIFAGPGQYPPEDFAAYGIVAFKSKASRFDRERHEMICEAYIRSLPHYTELDLEPAQQMVTVWPLESVPLANAINSADIDQACRLAIDGYGLLIAQSTIKHAEAAGWHSDGVGPFLFAWSPPSHKGRRDAIVLAYDLSSVETYQQALSIMQVWVDEIESDPQLWQSGWDIAVVRRKLRLWLDSLGPQLVAVVGLD